MSIDSIKTEGGETAVSPYEEGDHAMNELRWLFCESGGELGEHSSHNSLVQMALAGGHSGTRLEPYVEGEVTAPLPSPRQVRAAERQARYRAALRKLPTPHQAVLERRFSDRRPNAQIKGLLAQLHEEKLEPVVTYMLERGEIQIKTDGTDKELPGIVEKARDLLAVALGGYRRERGLDAWVAQAKRERRPRLKLVAAGASGASKRRLVPIEAPRKGRSP